MKMKKRIRFFLFPLVILFVILPLSSTVMAAEAKVNLGSTETYAVLAGSTITNTGPTVISGTVGGDIGLFPGTSITGFPPGTVGGTTHLTDEAASLAKTDLVAAYNDAASRTPTMDMSGQDLGGKTLTSGVYFFSSSAQLTGTLTLDAQGDPEAVFIFQIGSALTTASNSVVSLTNGARFCRVFWQVTSSATLGTNSQFAGHILATESITAATGATVQGQLMAQTGAVTLDSNTITNGICGAAAATSTPTPTAAATTATPVPTTGTTELTKTGENAQKQIMIGVLLLVISGSLVFLLVSRRKNIQR
ncbi:MAG: ice-binding family protein [Eubacteriales bacterium]